MTEHDASSIDELKARARRGDAEALQELRARGFFGQTDGGVSYPVSDAQRRLWVLDKMHPDGAVYNMPGAWRVRGTLDPDALGQALAALERRHETLRTSIIEVQGEPRQVIHAPGRLHLQSVDLSSEEAAALAGRASTLAAREAATPIRLETAPLCRAILSTLGPADHLLLLTIHHIVCDAWSLDLLLREWVHTYDRLSRGGGEPLPPLRIQYKDYTAWRRDQLERDGGVARS